MVVFNNQFNLVISSHKPALAHPGRGKYLETERPRDMGVKHIARSPTAPILSPFCKRGNGD